MDTLKNLLVFKVARVVVMVVCVGGSVGVLMRSVHGGHWVWGWVCWGRGRCVFGVWVSE